MREFLAGVWRYYRNGLRWLAEEGRRDVRGTWTDIRAWRRAKGFLGMLDWAAACAAQEAEAQGLMGKDWSWELYGEQLCTYHDWLVERNRADAEAVGPVFNMDDFRLDDEVTGDKVELVALYETGAQPGPPTFYDLSTGLLVDVKMIEGGDVEMAMQKYGSPEKGEVLSEEEHRGIWARLKKVGKKSVGELPAEEKEGLMDKEAEDRD